MPKLVFKRSSVTSKIPLPGDLDIGELAINLADKKIFSKNVSNEVIDLTPITEQRISDLEDLVNTKISANNYATGTVGGTIKMRLDGDTLYITNDGTNP
jgi:hypothetical protein